MPELDALKQELQNLSVKYRKCEILYNLASFYKLSGFFKLDIVKEHAIPTISDIAQGKQKLYDELHYELASGVDLSINPDDTYEYYHHKQWERVSKIRETYDAGFQFENTQEHVKTAVSELLSEVGISIDLEAQKSEDGYNITLIRLKDLKCKILEVYRGDYQTNS